MSWPAPWKKNEGFEDRLHWRAVALGRVLKRRLDLLAAWIRDVELQFAVPIIGNQKRGLPRIIRDNVNSAAHAFHCITQLGIDLSEAFRTDGRNGAYCFKPSGTEWIAPDSRRRGR